MSSQRDDSFIGKLLEIFG